MEITTGVDIIEVNRIQNMIEQYGNKIIEKIYTPAEIAYCEQKGNSKYQHYAARFAAKEAVFKAITKGTSKSIDWQAIEVLKEENGRPKINTEKMPRIHHRY